MSKEKKKKLKGSNGMNTFPVPLSLGEIKANLTIKSNIPSNSSKEEIIDQAINFHLQGNISEAIENYQFLINKGLEDPNIFSNYGSILRGLGKLKEAEIFTRKAIKIKPDFDKAHSNLGNILKDIGQLQEARIALEKAIELNPNSANSHYNLGNILKDLGLLQEAKISLKKTIELKPDFAKAHSNLGSIYHELGNLDKAEISTRQAIQLKANYAEAYNNLGNILKDLGKLEEAKISLQKAIELKSNFEEAYINLSITLYLMGNKFSALESIIQAHSLNPKGTTNSLLLKIFEREKNQNLIISKKNCGLIEENLDENPLILNRPVEEELINSLYNIKARDQEKHQKPTYGNAKGSDYNLFERNDYWIKIIKEDLTTISSNSIKSDILIADSFFTIFRSGGGLISHNHLNKFDSINGLNLAIRKFSLVYYLSIGDQNCDEPGILKLENPNQNILPTKGLIVIFPAMRNHSVFYKGKKDRIIIGVNFYRI